MKPADATDTFPRVGILETFGLSPLGSAVRDSLRAVTGRPHVPPSRWGLSSTRIFKPHISLPTWLGRRPPDGRVPVYNFFNRVTPPREEGYSVRVTYARDFRGGRWTYDGHEGTDFAVPVATPVTAAAPGRVLRVVTYMDHGGLKVCLDHGGGLITTSDHLSRALVREGDRVRRGQVIGLSGASGVEFIAFFPWVAPHLHLNVWLNGRSVDPFGVESAGEVPLWRTGNAPTPCGGEPEEEGFEPTEWDPPAVEAGIAACRDPAERERLRALEDVDGRAVDLLLLQNFWTALFEDFPVPCKHRFDRRPHLDLPFRACDYSGVAFPP